MGMDLIILTGQLATTMASVHPTTIKMLDASKKLIICFSWNVTEPSTVLLTMPNTMKMMARTVPIK